MMRCTVGLWVVLGLVLACGPGAAQSPEQVLTDTADYCAELQLQVDQALAHLLMQPPADVRALSDDGQEMCQHGEIRGGIARLRRALMVLRQLPGVQASSPAPASPRR